MSPTLLVPSPATAGTLSPLAQAGMVAVGGACGSMLRWAGGLALNTLPLPIAAGTLAVNLVGGALIGFSLVAFERMPSEAWRLLLVTGGLGGLTTFSAFSAESLGLVIKGQWSVAVLHALAHVGGALCAAALGWQVGRWVLP
jgi:CrcB protein